MKLLRELYLDLHSIPHFSFGRHKAANLVDVRRKYLAAEIDEGRLPIFHPIPGFLQIQFKDLVEWYEEFGNQIDRTQRRGITLEFRREILPLNQFQVYQQKRQFASACVMQAIAIGFLRCEACQYCGYDSALAHHRDYNLPMKVVWLCPRCHALEHSRLRQSNQSATPQLELFLKYFLPSGSLLRQSAGSQLSTKLPALTTAIALLMIMHAHAGCVYHGKPIAKLLVEEDVCDSQQSVANILPVVLFGRVAVRAAELKQGDRVTIACRLSGTRFTTPAGETRYGCQLIAEQLFLAAVGEAHR
jgi:hypothetical protein